MLLLTFRAPRVRTDGQRDATASPASWPPSPPAAHPRSKADDLCSARGSLVAELGEQGMVDAACVAAFFAGISRIVDATGLPVRLLCP